MFFFLNDTATTEIYTLPLHDALPIWRQAEPEDHVVEPPLEQDDEVLSRRPGLAGGARERPPELPLRSEEHTSELQSRQYLVCRLLLEKKKQRIQPNRLLIAPATHRCR